MTGTITWEPGDALIFARVVDDGSFTAAAAALDLPKSTVSRRVSRLEAALGLQLLRRTTRRLDLTDAGRAFYTQAAQAVQVLVEAEHAASAVLSEPHGRLRITAPAELSTSVFGMVLGFGRSYPDVQLDLDLTNSYVDLIERGYDVALRGGQAPTGVLDGRLLSQDDAILVASPDYLAARGTPKRTSDLERHESILFPRWVQDSAVELQTRRRSIRVPVRGRLTVNNLEAVRVAALGGHGIGLVPERHCEGDLREGALVRVLPGHSKALGGLWVVYPRTRFLSAKVRAFASPRRLAVTVGKVLAEGAGADGH